MLRTLMVKELSMVNSSIVLRLTLRISRERSSRADMIFRTWPGILGDIVFKSTLGPQNLTSTSATADFECATSSLAWSMELDVEQEEEEGDGSSEELSMELVGDRYGSW